MGACSIPRGKKKLLLQSCETKKKLQNLSIAALEVLVSQCTDQTNLDYLESCAAQTAPIHVTHRLRRTDSLPTEYGT